MLEFLRHLRMAVFLMALLVSTAKSQINQCSSVVDRGYLTVDIVPLGNWTCGSGVNNCSKEVFEVKLLINNPDPNAPIPPCLRYDAFEVVIKFSAQSNALGLTALSSINELETRLCSVSSLGNKLIIDKNSVTLSLTEENYGNTSLPYFTLGSTSVPLFYIVVDAWPNEELTLSCVNGYYAWTDRNEMSGNCSFGAGVSEIRQTLVPPSDSRVQVSFADPSGGNTSPFSDMPCKVTLDAGTSINHLQFQLELTPDEMGFTVPTIIDRPGDGVTLVQGDLETEEHPVTKINRYFIPITLFGEMSATENIPFDVRVLAPATFQKCGKVCPTLHRLLATHTSGDCVTPVTGGLKCAEFKNCLPACPQNISIHAKANGAGTPSGGCNLRVDISFNWTGETTTYQLSGAKLKFQFTAPDALAIIGVSQYGAGLSFSCPQPNNKCAIGCSSIDNAAKTFEVCFEKDNTDPAASNFTVTKGTDIFTSIVFDAGVGGSIDAVTLLEAEFEFIGSNGDRCVPFTTLTTSNFPALVPVISGQTQTANGKNVEEVDMALTGGTCSNMMLKTSSLGYYSFCACGYNEFTVTPAKNDNPLNGVTTLDLALISKHILGTELLNSPYKMIAADANKSNSITTFDVVELRKLILGIYDELPSNTSWRFVPKNYAFPNPLTPWSFPGILKASPMATEQDFVAVKIGDVNLSWARPAQALEPLAMSAPLYAFEPGQVLSLPLRFDGKVPLSALQAAIRFDPETLEFLSPAEGDVPGMGAECFNTARAKAGLLRLVWVGLDPDEGELRPGQILCRLNFRAKRRLAAGEAVLRFDQTDRLIPEGYSPHGDAHPLALRADAGTEQRDERPALVKAQCRPNPSDGAVSLAVENETAIDRARLFVLNALGIRVFYQEAALPKGGGQIPLEGAAAWPPGFYQWVLLNGSERVAEGSFVRQ